MQKKESKKKNTQIGRLAKKTDQTNNNYYNEIIK